MTPSILRDRLPHAWLLLAVLSLVAFLVAPPAARAEEPAKGKVALKVEIKVEKKAGAKADALDTEPAQWLRFVDDKRGGGKLEVAVGTYNNEDGVTVHLVGAVHVGEKSYYEGLAKSFEDYDVLLYEMVKPKDAGAPKRGARGTSLIGMFQRFLKDALELDFQLDGIDYTKPNFVHADLDVETFEQMQAERGESILGLMLQQMIREMSRQMEGKGPATKQPDLLELIQAFDSPDRARQFKLILGRSFGDLEEQIAGMQGTVLVTERNKKALSVLKDAIRGGKKNIGVFYGAAHMPDLESRLALMGFTRTDVVWRTAWDMTEKKVEAKEKE